MAIFTTIFRTIFPAAPSRIHAAHSFWDGKGKQFTVAVLATLVLLQLLFLGNLSYLYGALYRDNSRAHKLHFVMVDYDQGVLGQSLKAAVQELTAPTFPTIKIHDISEYPDPSDVVHKVRSGDYWAGIYTHAGASDRLAAALQGGTAATSYNSSDVVTWVWNGARYPAASAGFVEAPLATLIAVMAIAYDNINGTSAIQTMNTSDKAAVLALLNPITSASIDIQPTDQGTRVLYNTVSMVLPIVQQFFFLLAMNGISAGLQFYRHLPVKNNALIRIVIGSLYTFIGSLCMTGYIWAYKEGWAVGGGQFMTTWMVLWLYMHINFMVLDFATGFIPMSFTSFFVLTWIIFSVAATIFPFELNPGFYQWGYFLPSHSAWETLVTIWSHGGANRLYRTLPILFAWEIALIPCVASAMHYRCLKAVKEATEQEQAAMAKYSGDAKKTHTNSGSVGAGSTTELRQLDSNREDNLEGDGPGNNPSMPVPFVGTLTSMAANNNSNHNRNNNNNNNFERD